MLTRRLSLKLLAPTVLVSLLLVAACTAGAFFLNRLHLNASAGLRENVGSMQAAAHLEKIARELVGLLRDSDGDPKSHISRIERLNSRLRPLLEESEKLANLQPEQQCVAEIAAGVDSYLDEWRQHPEATDVLVGIVDRRILLPVRRLHDYNIEQVSASDTENTQIVNRLTLGFLAVGVGAPVAGLLLGYAVARSLYQSIHQLSVRIRDAAGRLNGDLPAVVVEPLDDLPDLHRQLGGVVEEIERVVARLQQREHEVLRAEQLAAVGQVAAGVAHELRNPLTSVKMLVQTGLEGLQPTGLPPEDLQIIEHEIRRMEVCIQTFLDFARPPSAERRRTDLLAVVRRSMTLVEARCRRQGVRLEADTPPGPVELCLDGEQIHQVLLNLLINALDVLPRGGLIRVAVQRSGGSAPEVKVVVRDDGPGIAESVRGRLFDPFVSSKETGLGLGLSICRRLVEAHGGTIRGEDAPEGGAAFTFTLPS